MFLLPQDRLFIFNLPVLLASAPIGWLKRDTHTYAHTHVYTDQSSSCPHLKTRNINLVSLIKTFKAESYDNILCIFKLDMSLAVGDIYLPCHLVSLLMPLGTPTFGFPEIFNKGQANNVFLNYTFPSLTLVRVSCRDN